jgi:hypothetical protein
MVTLSPAHYVGLLKKLSVPGTLHKKPEVVSCLREDNDENKAVSCQCVQSLKMAVLFSIPDGRLYDRRH